MAYFDFTEFDAYAKEFSNMTAEFDAFIREFHIEYVNRIINRTKLRQSGKLGSRQAVDTGAMLGAWQMGEIRQDGRNIEIDILNGMDYASFIEYGYQHVGGRWMDGYFMMTLSIDEADEVAQEMFDIRLKQFLKKYGLVDV
jgi:hypothetical protein